MKPKFFIVTTTPGSLGFFAGQYPLLQDKFDVIAISSNEDLEYFGKKFGVKVHCVPMKRDISLMIDMIGLLNFIKYFHRERPMVVHGNTPKGSLLSLLAARLTRVPIRIYMCHGLRYQGCTGFKRKLLMTMERITCKCATDVVCVSKGVAEVIHTDGICNSMPTVVWNGSVKGIDAEKFNPEKPFNREEIRKKYGLAKTDFVLTFVGRIVRDKGIQELVDAFTMLHERHKDMRLLLVGTVENEGNAIMEETNKCIKENNAIIALGRQDDVPEILSVTNLFVFPSYREGFGLSLMEAGAMGVPSISSDIIGCNEIIEDGKTGLLIPTHSPEAIVEAVERLYDDIFLYEEMRNNCRKSIVSRYEYKELWSRYLDFYSKKVELFLTNNNDS